MYPNYPSYPGQPSYPGADQNQYGMPNPGAIGFDAPPSNPSYPSYPGYQQPSGGFPLAPGGGGYPQQPGTYPQPGGNYPPTSGPSYPHPGGSGGYPSHGQYGDAGYPSQGAGGAGYPHGGSGGYPSSQSGGYPTSGYPSQPPPGGNYPPSGGNYPPSNVGGYPPTGNSSYPQQQQTSYPNMLPNQFQPNQGGGMYPNLGGFGPGTGAGAGAGPGPMGGYGGGPQPAAIRGTPTLRPFQPFNPNDDASKLYKAMKGIGTDETTLIDILCRRTSQQRQEIAIAYKSSFGKDLVKNLVDELRGNFESVFKSLMRTPAQLEAHDLKDAIDGMGTKESSVIDILCTKQSNADMIALKNAYRQKYNRDLENELRGDVSGYFQRFLVSLIAANRNENAPVDPHKAQMQAREIYEAGEKRVGTNEMVFNRIFATENLAQLRLVFEEYYKQTGHDIEKAIKKEMSGDVERAFLAVAQIARNPAGYYAQRLHETMAGGGTHDRALIRNIVLRSEIDMMDVKTEFQRRYGKTLESFIKSDCSGDYKRALLCLVGDLNWR